MATTVDTLLVRIEADMSDLKRDLNRISQQTEQQTNKMAASFRKVGTALAALGGGAALGSLVKGFVQAGIEVENLSVRFNTLFGDAEEGGRALQALTGYASQVPFSLQDIQRGAGSLAVVSKDANQLSAALKITGNIAASSGLSFQDAASNLQRAFTGGIGAADLFRDSGVKAMAGFEDGVTYSTQQTIDMLQKAFGAGGEYDGITDQLAQTTQGALSMLGDAWFSFSRTVAESGLNESFVKLVDSSKNLLIAIRPLAIVLGKVLGVALDGFAKAVSFVTENLKGLVIAMGAVIALNMATTMLKFGFQALMAARALTKLNVAFKVMNTISAISLRKFFLIASAMGFVATRFDAVNEMVDTLLSAFQVLIPEEVLQRVDEFAEKMGLSEAGMKALKDQMEQGPSAFEIGGLGAGIADIISLRQEIEKINGGTPDLNTKLQELNKELARVKENGTPEAIAATQQAIDTLTAQIQASNPIIGQLQDSLAQFSSGISQSFVNAVADGKDAMKSLENLFNDMVKKLIAKAIELFVVNQILNSVFSVFGGGTPFESGQLFGKAGGGTVQQGMPTLVGERGPELFVPSGAGKIMNNMNTQNALGGGGVTINQTIQVETGVSQTVRAEMLSLLPVIKEDTINAVADSRRRGGSFAQAFS